MVTQAWTFAMPNSLKHQFTSQQIFQLEKWLVAEELKTEFVKDLIYHIDEEYGIDWGKTYTKTIDSKNWMKKHPNLLKDHSSKQANEVLVSLY